MSNNKMAAVRKQTRSHGVHVKQPIKDLVKLTPTALDLVFYVNISLRALIILALPYDAMENFRRKSWPFGP